MIRKKRFVVVALNKDNKIFVLHIAGLPKPIIMPIYPSSKVHIVLLTKTEIFAEYSDFWIIFFQILR